MEYDGLKGRFVFQGPKFEDQFEVLGTPYLELKVSTSARDLNLFITIQAKDVNDQTVIHHGNHDQPIPSFCRARYRLSHRNEANSLLSQDVPVLQSMKASPIESGKVYPITVPLNATSFVFDKGTSLELELGATDPEGVIFLHQGGDLTEDRFSGKNVILSHGKLYLPTVRRSNE